MRLNPHWDPCSTLDVELLVCDERLVVRWTAWNCVCGRS